MDQGVNTNKGPECDAKYSKRIVGITIVVLLLALVYYNISALYDNSDVCYVMYQISQKFLSHFIFFVLGMMLLWASDFEPTKEYYPKRYKILTEKQKIIEEKIKKEEERKQNEEEQRNIEMKKIQGEKLAEYQKEKSRNEDEKREQIESELEDNLPFIDFDK